MFGVMSTCFRIGVLTSPYLGQVFLQRVSALGAVLIFSAMALIGFAFSIFLPHAGDKYFTSTSISKGVFRKIFKDRKLMKTKQNDDGMKSVTNPAYKDDEKTIRTIVEEVKRKDNNTPVVLPVQHNLNSTSVEEVNIVPNELVVVALTPCNPI